MRAPPLTPLAAAVLQVPRPERALVIGSGDGEAALFLAREFPSARVRGVEASDDLVRVASSRVGLDPEARLAFKRGQPRSLPYPDDFFDLVVQIDGRSVPREIARVLQVEGHLILVRSRSGGALAGARQSLLRRQLARQGLIAVREEAAGDGNFFVGRLELRR